MTTTISVKIQQSTNTPASISIMDDDITATTTINSTDIGKVSITAFLKLDSDWLSQIAADACQFETSKVLSEDTDGDFDWIQALIIAPITFVGGMAVTFCVVGCIIIAFLKKRGFNAGFSSHMKNFEETVETKAQPTPKQGPKDCFPSRDILFFFLFMSYILTRTNSPWVPVPKIHEVIPKPADKIEEIKPEAIPKPTKMEINEEPSPKRSKKDSNKRMRSPMKIFKSWTTPKTSPPKMAMEVKADVELIELDESPSAGT